ncbi:MAG: hypothetical protein H8E66_23395 [Planctomycetes bacterium]|nr:hypothetical protein [Planctomycetota bacterium]
MDPSNEKLLDLLRLTDRLLTQVDSATLQRMIAEDVELRTRAERLGLVLHASESIGTDALWHALDLSDAELTAEMFDGAAALEVSTSGDLVRHIDELQSIKSAATRDIPKASVEAASRSMLAAMSQELGEEVQQETPRVNGTAVKLEVAERTPRHLRRAKSRSWYLVPVAVGIVVAVTILVMSLASQRVTPPSSLPSPGPNDIVNDSPEPEVQVPDAVPPEPEPTLHEMPQIADERPQAELVEPIVVDKPGFQPEPMNPEVERQVVPQRLKWERISGLVATQVEGSDSWYAIKVDSMSATNSDGSPKLFRALGNSWGEARTESGIRVVLGPGAVARVGVSMGDTTKVQLDIQQGKVSVGELPASTQVVVTHQADQTEWLVSNHDTALAFDLQQSTSEMQLVQGSLQFDGQAFTGPSKVTYNDGGWEEGRLARTAPWLVQPPKLSSAERQLSIIATEEGDLVAGLMMNRPGMNAALAMAATDWSLSLDPARTVPLALASPIAARRGAAARWMIDPSVELATLRSVLFGLRPLLQGSQCSVARWITVIRGETPMSQTLAQNMLLGLRPNEPMFVREIALASLMNLSGQTFPTYNIHNPTRQSISQVTRALQPWIIQLRPR